MTSDINSSVHPVPSVQTPYWYQTKILVLCWSI